MGRKLRRSLSTSSGRGHTSTLTITTPDLQNHQVTVYGNQSILEVLIKVMGPEASEMLIFQEDDPGAPLDGTASVSLLRRESGLKVLPQKSPTTMSCFKHFLEEERIYGLILESCIKLYGKPLLAAKIITELEYKTLFRYISCVAEASISFCIRLEKYIEAGLLKDTPEEEEEKEEEVDQVDAVSQTMNILEELVHEGVLEHKDIKTEESPKIQTLPKKSQSSFYKCLEQVKSDPDLPFNVQWKFIDDKIVEENEEYDTLDVWQKGLSDTHSYNSSEDENYESIDGLGASDYTPYESIEDLYNGINKPEDVSESRGEEEVLLEQLVCGDLLDSYSDMVQAWPKISLLLWSLEKRNALQLRLMKGAALYSLREYLTMPMERLSQYERLVQGGGGSGSAVRKRGQRLSDLERVQGLFPNDYLALHHHDVLQATANATLKSKTVKKRPSLDQMMTGSANTSCNSNLDSSQHDIRQFVMEAPCQMSSVTNGNDSPQERHLFLFSDLLLVAKSRGNNAFKLKEAVRLCEAWVSADDSDTGFLLGWAGQTSPVTYLVIYPTQAARDSWLRKIQNTIGTQLLAEPKSTNIQVFFKDPCSLTEYSKMMAVTPEMTANSVIRHGLQLIFGAVLSENDQCLKDFSLWMKGNRDGIPAALLGCERPHAIQMSKLRQILSNEDGFDMNHVNSKSNPCEIVFELRKLNKTPNRIKTPLKLFRRSSGKLFGVALVRLCPTGVLPPVVLTMLKIVHRRGPHTQGIFRKSANVKALKHLREKIDNIGANNARFPELDNSPVLLVASLLKDFLRSLPQPVMLDSLYPSWMAILGMGPTEKIASIRNLLLKLPKAHYNLLSHFIALLVTIARKSSINLMCPMNLAVCVGPSLLWPPQHSESSPKAVPPLIELLIIHADLLFGPQILNIFNKPNFIPSASLSLDSGAEESDSLNSVGLSLDSLDLNCNRKEKLSLSRDSGLTMSEDDSHSNGGNSPAPRFGQNQMLLPHLQIHQAQRVFTTKCYDADLQNTGLPKINLDNYINSRNINRNFASPDIFYNEHIYGNKFDVQKTIEMQQRIYNSITEQNKIIQNQSKGHEIYASNPLTVKVHNNLNKPNMTSNSSPSKYLTGLEPEKPPRLGITRAQRNTKGQSLFLDKNINPHKLYHRAKSSDDLLERGDDSLYGNLKRQQQQQHRPEIVQSVNSPQTYCRVYQGWEHRLRNASTVPQNNALLSAPITETSKSAAAKNFTRKDWARQASRTKSLEGFSLDNPPNVEDKQPLYNQIKDIPNGCSLRTMDPSHFCTRQCQSFYENPSSAKFSKVALFNNSDDFNNRRLVHSKSLANIVLHSSSNSSDTLYQPSNYHSTESPISSEHSSSNNYNVEYADNVYYNKNSNYCDKPLNNLYQGPPVPPRKGSHQKVLNIEKNNKKVVDRFENIKNPYASKYLPTKSNNFILALEDSTSDTESESYV